MPKKTNKEKSKNRSPENNQRRGKQETREILMDAAMDLFAQRGYRGASVRDLAAEAGVTTGAFYSNFKSKRDIYISILDRIASTLEIIMEELTRDTIEVMKKRGSPKVEFEILVRPISMVFEEMSRHEALLQILLREGMGQDPDFQREIDRVWERFVEMIKRALDALVVSGMAKPFDTLLFARAIMPMAISMSIYDFRTKGKRRDEIVVLLASLLQGGAAQWTQWKELAEKTETGTVV